MRSQTDSLQNDDCVRLHCCLNSTSLEELRSVCFCCPDDGCGKIMKRCMGHLSKTALEAPQASSCRQYSRSLTMALRDPTMRGPGLTGPQLGGSSSRLQPYNWVIWFKFNRSLVAAVLPVKPAMLTYGELVHASCLPATLHLHAYSS